MYNLFLSMKNPLINLLAAAFVFSAFVLPGCVKMSDLPATLPGEAEAISINVPPNFNYRTTQSVAINVSLLTNDNKPLAGVLVSILDPANENSAVLYKAITNEEGKLTGTLQLPTYFEKVIVDASYIGIMRNAKVKIVSNEILASLGGNEGFGGNVELSTLPYGLGTVYQPRQQDVNDYVYMGNFNSNGKPNYLESPSDVISSSLLSYVNASLPEGKSVPTYHPAYLNSTAETNINIKQTADIWITFVHEGAAYTNSLAYFTYPTGTQPKKTSDITALTMVFPNASFNGSGGSLTSGNKVKLGRFSAGTSIGFCLIANGWSDAAKAVGAGLNKFFTIDDLNPETSPALKRHSVLLKDDINNLYLVGFDDQRRDQNSDEDFNDLIFYVSANTPSAISSTNVNLIDSPVDTDNDGVSDVYDQFPTDPLRAYVNYYPSIDSYTSTAFEDTWPGTGDYDMNDVVVDQRYKIINNGQNKTVEIFADYIMRASGGSFNNGFGVQFPFAPSAVASVTGSKVVNNNIISMASNGCESGQSKAVIFPFDDFYSVMQRQGNNYINTDPAIAFIKPDTIKMKISLSSPITAVQLGTPPFNPFIVCNKSRGNEVHLPGELPTDKANTSLFNTSKDNTVPSLNRYYKTITNLPFGICIPQKFDYPIEGKPVNSVYLKFDEWAKSGGTSYPGWYKDSTGYRSVNYFYKP